VGKEVGSGWVSEDFIGHRKEAVFYPRSSYQTGFTLKSVTRAAM
jgi:hypothetical protein